MGMGVELRGGGGGTGCVGAVVGTESAAATAAILFCF